MKNLRVFKFGGASLKNADAIRNVANILQQFKGEPLCIVVSATGKSTNALETVVEAHKAKDGSALEKLEQIKQDHYQICLALLGEENDVYQEINDLFVAVEWVLDEEPHENYDYMYDQIVSVGELASSQIVAAYLKHVQLPAHWLDARDVVLFRAGLWRRFPHGGRVFRPRSAMLDCDRGATRVL